MKFSSREKLLIEFMQRHTGQEFTIDELMKNMNRKTRIKPEHFRQSILSSLGKLRGKLSIYGIDLVTVSPVGRGHKAIYFIDGRISTLIT